jgi:hypothetical protein
MIRPLRQRHRQIFVALGVFLPLAFAVGIAARKPVPAVAELPPALTPAPPPVADLVWRRGDLFSKAPVEVRLLREKDSGRFAVQFSAATGFLKPDLMVYWVAGSTGRTNSLPDNAVLLGEFDSSALPWPAAAAARGVLVLYSLADNEMVDVSKPFNPL